MLLISYTLVYNMGEADKTIRVSAELHARITAHNRDDETLNDTLERLVGGPSLRELAGTLSGEEADRVRDAIEESHDAHDEEIDQLLDETK